MDFFVCWCFDIGSTFRQGSSEWWTPKVLLTVTFPCFRTMFLQRIEGGLLVFLDDLSWLVWWTLVLSQKGENLGCFSGIWSSNSPDFGFQRYILHILHAPFAACIIEPYFWMQVQLQQPSLVSHRWKTLTSWTSLQKKMLGKCVPPYCNLSLKPHLSFPESKVGVCLVGWYLSWSGNLEHLGIRKSKSSKMGCVLFVEVFVGFLELKMLRDVKLQANPWNLLKSQLFGNVGRKYEIWWKELEFLDWNQFKRHISRWFVWVKWMGSWFIPRFERRTFRTLSGRRMQGGM